MFTLLTGQVMYNIFVVCPIFFSLEKIADRNSFATYRNDRMSGQQGNLSVQKLCWPDSLTANCCKLY